MDSAHIPEQSESGFHKIRGPWSSSKPCWKAESPGRLVGIPRLSSGGWLRMEIHHSFRSFSTPHVHPGPRSLCPVCMDSCASARVPKRRVVFGRLCEPARRGCVGTRLRSSPLSTTRVPGRCSTSPCRSGSPHPKGLSRPKPCGDRSDLVPLRVGRRFNRKHQKRRHEHATSERREQDTHRAPSDPPARLCHLGIASEVPNVHSNAGREWHALSRSSRALSFMRRPHDGPNHPAVHAVEDESKNVWGDWRNGNELPSH